MKIPYDDIDKECIKLCKAMNRLTGVTTQFSCCGHGESSFSIVFFCKNVNISYLMPIVIDLPDDWSCSIDVTSTGKGRTTLPRFVLLSGSKIGEIAYKDANDIADKINKWIEERNKW